MTSKTGGTGEAAFHMLQPERDLRLNWEVDLAEKLESYLLQICTGEFQSGEDENHNSVNFAEGEGSFFFFFFFLSIFNFWMFWIVDYFMFLTALCAWDFFEGVAALLLQGSIQVYSRKVEYLYSLVLRALEFLSEKRFDYFIQFFCLYN